MRLDKFMKVAGLIKRRTVANETADEGNIKLNGKVAKPSVDVKAGDTIEIDMWNYRKVVKVLQPITKNSIAKADIDDYIEVVEYIVKEV